MKLNKNLILVGMMASGKSTIGRLLAKKLNLKFFDTDFIIEKKTKMKIFEIFEKKGEAVFRNLEKKITLNLINKNNCVISFGGGAFISEIIRKAAQKKNTTIWLNWDLETLIDRIKKNNNKRPVASNLSNNELKDLLINRSKIYSKAKYKLNCENMGKAEIVDSIIQMLKL
jgi:shikimate kinase